MSAERVTVPCRKCGLPVSPGACAGEPLVYHDKAEHCREALRGALTAAESSAAEWRALAVGLVERLRYYNVSHHAKDEVDAIAAKIAKEAGR